ncbi:DUF3301 domain-containing protein [Celerinatantimonas diazotrophica]|uniref:Uncharacterized protein DUF3301 n=1 Tax=Celerinatantimonas diazotrophica TaxID=412034 RepID=A0A4R1J9I8_9GAMM|nr:DUF3301 domain-containing protein [Celerinatantimonas diazotrophica]TCK47275.1 uncharacterized protein DUF3301 [Celerinatantimonas diazotrophica]CAG9296047.1 hypothetical protein CEDIAZO_01186 [Celerinatantimonas diazotrophica]
MASVFALFGLFVLGGLFWRHRQQAEMARLLIVRHCRHLELQLLDVHYAGINLAMAKKLQLTFQYRFEFTNVPQHRYSGFLWLNRTGYEFIMPPYPDLNVGSNPPISDDRAQLPTPDEDT